MLCVWVQGSLKEKKSQTPPGVFLMCSKEIFLMCNSLISGERTLCVWWVLLSLESCVTTVRLSIASRNEGDSASLERPEPNSERDEQVSTRNRAVQDTGRIWSARSGDWKCSLNWSTVWVWELAFLRLGFLFIDCRAESLLKTVLEKQRCLLLVLVSASATPEQAALQLFSESLLSSCYFK